MYRMALAAAPLLVAAPLLLAAKPTAAQNLQSWVSRTGSDANPCTEAAPCQSLAAALPQTLAGGQISCRDSGDYGSVTIAKSITIDCRLGTIGAASGNAVTVSAGPGDIVVLIGLQIDGMGSSTGSGILATSMAKLVLDQVAIRNFRGNGLTFQPATDARLFVVDTAMTNNGIAGSAAILVQPSASLNAHVRLTRVRLVGNAAAGVRVKTAAMASGGVAAWIGDSQVDDNGFGVLVQGSLTGPAVAMSIFGTEVERNASHGLASVGLSQMVVGNSGVVANGPGQMPSHGGTILDAGGNTVYGNYGNLFTGSVTRQ